MQLINFDQKTRENIKNTIQMGQKISDRLYRILIIRGSVSEKTNALLNLIIYQPGIDKVYLKAKDPYETKYQLLTKKRESVGLKQYHDFKAFID